MYIQIQRPPGGKTAPTEMEGDGMGRGRSQLYRIQMGVWAFAPHKLVAVYILRKKKKKKHSKDHRVMS